MNAAAKFYHYLTLRLANGNTIDKAIGCDADNIDDAYRDRCRIAKQYHPNQIVALTTHNAGVGPACR